MEKKPKIPTECIRGLGVPEFAVAREHAPVYLSAMGQNQRTSSQDALRQAIVAADWDQVRAMLDAKPGLQRMLISALHETDRSRLQPTLHAFTILAEILPEERLRDLARKLMWMLNDESGNHCPNASLALAAIAVARVDVVSPHLASLKIHAADPGVHMASVCTEAVRRIEAVSGVAS